MATRESPGFLACAVSSMLHPFTEAEAIGEAAKALVLPLLLILAEIGGAPQRRAILSPPSEVALAFVEALADGSLAPRRATR